MSEHSSLGSRSWKLNLPPYRSHNSIANINIDLKSSKISDILQPQRNESPKKSRLKFHHTVANRPKITPFTSSPPAQGP
jgi:hypothetical protein